MRWLVYVMFCNPCYGAGSVFDVCDTLVVVILIELCDNCVWGLEGCYTCPSPRDGSSNWGGYHQDPPLTFLGLARSGRRRQLHMIVCGSLTRGIWMLYLDVQSVSDNTPRGIDCYSRTCKTSLTAPQDSKGVQGTVWNWLLYSDMQSVSDCSPRFRRCTQSWGYSMVVVGRTKCLQQHPWNIYFKHQLW